jgi:hypothetical protein
MEVSIKGENEDKMKPNWACAVEAAWREEWAWILSRDHFVVDLPCSDIDRLPVPAAEPGLTQEEMGPIHQVGKGGEWSQGQIEVGLLGGRGVCVDNVSSDFVS